MSAQFDRHADSYTAEVDASVSFSGQGADFFAERKADELVATVTRTLGETASMALLDVGCGIGLTDQFLQERFGELHGVDLSAAEIAKAQVNNPLGHYQSYEGDRLPFDDERFDVALAVCVAHHVEPPDRPGFAAELARVVRPGGLVVVFEHNPYNPLTRFAVSRCEFDEGVQLLRRTELTEMLTAAGLHTADRRYILFLPLRARWAHRVDRALHRLPLGGQHFVAARKPLASS